MSKQDRPRVVQMRRRPKYGEWPSRPQFADPINPLDTFVVARATSILHGITEPGGCITPAQARDVLAWHERHTTPTRRAPLWRRAIGFITGTRPTTRSNA